MEAKKLTENSYMLMDKNGTKIGLTFKRGDYIISTHDLSQTFKSIEDIAFMLKENVIYTEIPSNEKEEMRIEGYPIKHKSYYDYKNEKYITYRLTGNSKIEFVAGWWILHHNTGYYMSLSPKLSTLNEDSVGPFKDGFECKTELARLNKLKKS